MTSVGDAHGRHSAAVREQPLFGSPDAIDGGAIDTGVIGTGAAGGGPDYVSIQQTPELVSLRRKQRWFIFPLAALFTLWYMAFVLLAAYEQQFMARPVLGLINIGMVLGLAQFVSTLVIMLAYCRYARRTLDPAGESLRDRFEGQA